MWDRHPTVPVDRQNIGFCARQCEDITLEVYQENANLVMGIMDSGPIESLLPHPVPPGVGIADGMTSASI